MCTPLDFSVDQPSLLQHLQVFGDTIEREIDCSAISSTVKRLWVTCASISRSIGWASA